MIKNTTIIAAEDFTTLPLATGGTAISDLVNTPRDIQFDVQIELTLSDVEIVGNIIVELISVNSSGDEFLPADSDDNRTITLLSEDLVRNSTVYFAKGIDRVAGISNLKFKITNNSGATISSGQITLGKLQF